MSDHVEEGAEDEVELVEPALVPVEGGPRDDAFGRGARNTVKDVRLNNHKTCHALRYIHLYDPKETL